MTVILSQVLAQSQADNFTSKANGGKLQIYSGTRPATPQVAITTQVKLIEFTLANPAFGASVISGVNAVATGNVGSIAPVAGSANGTAVWGRVLDSTGTAIWDGDVGTAAGSDFQLGTTAVLTTQSISLQSMTVTQPTGA